MGESYLQLHDYSRAAKEFERVAREFPMGNKVPDALLQASSCYIQLQQDRQAKATLEKLVSGFPQSLAAQKAKGMIVQLDRNRS